MPELSFRRRQIVQLLGGADYTAAELARALEREPTNVGRDLRIMRAAGLVSSTADGPFLRWSLTKAGGRG